MRSRLEAILRRERNGPTDRLVRGALGLLTPGYRLAVHLRNRAFDTGRREPRQLPQPVISVGNLTTGGTGKTPMVVTLVNMLVEMGRRPAVLTRGYGGDEPLELAQQMPCWPDNDSRVPIEVNPDRFAQGVDALKRRPDISCFVMDDGFQHRQLHRDLDIVLIDATQPFGHEQLLPAGLLREPLSALRRANAIVITRADQVSADALAALAERLESIAGRPPVAQAVHTWSGFRRDQGDGPAETSVIDSLPDVPLAGVCAIGNPNGFERMLRAHASLVVQVYRFADHHGYTRNELDALLADARQRGAEAIVTTSKDRVKWARLEWSSPLPVYCPQLEIRFTEGEHALRDKLANTVNAGATA